MHVYDCSTEVRNSKSRQVSGMRGRPDNSDSMVAGSGISWMA